MNNVPVLPLQSKKKKKMTMACGRDEGFWNKRQAQAPTWVLLPCPREGKKAIYAIASII